MARSYRDTPSLRARDARQRGRIRRNKQGNTYVEFDDPKTGDPTSKWTDPGYIQEGEQWETDIDKIRTKHAKARAKREAESKAFWDKVRENEKKAPSGFVSKKHNIGKAGAKTSGQLAREEADKIYATRKAKMAKRRPKKKQGGSLPESVPIGHWGRGAAVDDETLKKIKKKKKKYSRKRKRATWKEAKPLSRKKKKYYASKGITGFKMRVKED